MDDSNKTMRGELAVGALAQDRSRCPTRWLVDVLTYPDRIGAPRIEDLDVVDTEVTVSRGDPAQLLVSGVW